MRLLLPHDQIAMLREMLVQAGTKEIGGQLFGEQLAPSDFLVSEITFQKRPGTFARFVVDLVQAARDAMRFFELTEHRYSRFNYIGEWHSHPSFEVCPSNTDIATMKDLVSDQDFHGSFAVLLITRLTNDKLSNSAWLFDPLGRNHPVDLEVEQ